MHSNQFNETTNIKIKSTLLMKLFVLLPHLVVTVIFLILLYLGVLTVYYFIVLAFFIIVSLLYFSNLHFINATSRSITHINKVLGGDWKLTLKDSIVVKAKMLDTSFSSSLFVILNFQDANNKNYTSFITRDCLESDEFRRLKVLIKTSKKEM